MKIFDVARVQKRNMRARVAGNALISDATGKKITYQEISPADFKSGLVSAGLPEAYVDFLVLIFSFLREGYNAGLTSNVKEILGREPSGIERYVADFKSAWI